MPKTIEDNMEHIQIVKIEVCAKPASELLSCIKESIKLAMKEEKDVVLYYGRKKYLICINNLFDLISENPTWT